MMIKKHLSIALALLAALSSCQKNNSIPGPDKGTVRLQFSNKVGTDVLRMAGNWYVNENRDSFTVTKFNYYLSNIRLNGDKPFAEPNSYHLVLQYSVGSQTINLSSVPTGVYKSLSFTIGIDSTRTASGPRSGDLSALYGMFLDSTRGYVTLQFEGTSPQSTADSDMVRLNPGGFQGTNSTLRTVTLDFPAPLSIQSDEQHIQLTADVLALFKSPNKISFAATPMVLAPGPEASMLADNYAHMFTITGMTK